MKFLSHLRMSAFLLILIVPSIASIQFESESVLIPDTIKINAEEEVTLSFANTRDGVNSKQVVNVKLVDALAYTLDRANQNLSENDKIRHLKISATTNGRHSANSNHYIGTAIDISGINYRSIREMGRYSAKTRELQKAFDTYDFARENFGPYMKHKTYKTGETKSVYVKGHYGHVHLSVQSPKNGVK